MNDAGRGVRSAGCGVLASEYGAAAMPVALVVAAVCTMLVLAGRAPLWIAGAGFAAVVVTISVGLSMQSSGVFARPTMSAATGRAEIALTFDDGPDPRWTPAVLDMLDARGQRATFFVIGARAERHPELLNDIARRGHEIANHTWHHSYVTAFAHPRSLASELDRANALIERSTGVRPRWFRAPVGLLSPRIEPAVRLAGLNLVAWTATARDGVQSASVRQAFARLDHALAPGAILVLHDALMHGEGKPIASSVLSLLLDRMDTAGLRSVTLSDLCSADPTAVTLST